MTAFTLFSSLNTCFHYFSCKFSAIKFCNFISTYW